MTAVAVPLELEYKLKSLLAQKKIEGFSIEPNGKVIMIIEPENLEYVKSLKEKYKLITFNIIYTNKIVAL